MTVATIEASLSTTFYNYRGGGGNPPGDYLDCQTAATCLSAPGTANYPQIGQEFDADVPDFYDVRRAGAFFDLSAYSGVVLSAATLSLYGYEDGTLPTDFDITIVDGSVIEDTPIDDDYGDLLSKTTSWGSFATTGWTLEAYNIINFNATGLAAAQAALGGTFKIGLRSSRDISATTPKLNGASYYYEWVTAYGLITNKKPRLTLTYPSAFIPVVTIM